MGLWKKPLNPVKPLAPGAFELGSWGDRRDFHKFAEAYGDPQSGCNLPEQFMTHYSPIVTGPIKYLSLIHI